MFLFQDPAIHVDAKTKHPVEFAAAGDTYPPFDQGVAKDIFIKWPTTYASVAAPDSVGPNRAMLGKVSNTQEWPLCQSQSNFLMEFFEF